MATPKRTRPPQKRGPKPERLVVPPEQVGGILDRLLNTPKTKARKPTKKKPRS